MSMFDVTSTIVIAVPRERVAAFAMNPDNFNKFMEGVKTVELAKAEPMEVGSKFALVFDAGGGKSKSINHSALLYEPGYAMRLRHLDGTFPTEDTYVFEDTETEGQTLVKIRTKETITGLTKIAQPFLAKGAKGRNEKILSKLKQLLERGG